MHSIPLAFALVPVASCAVGPRYVPPEPELPDAWNQQLVRGLVEGEASLQTWWTKQPIFGI